MEFWSENGGLGGAKSLIFHCFFNRIVVSAFFEKAWKLHRKWLPKCSQNPLKIWHLALEDRIFAILGGFLRSPIFDEFSIGKKSAIWGLRVVTRRFYAIMVVRSAHRAGSVWGSRTLQNYEWRSDTPWHPALRDGGGGFKGLRPTRGPKNTKTMKNTNMLKMYFGKNMSFWKVLSKTDFRFEFSVKNYVFQHRTRILFFAKKL